MGALADFVRKKFGVDTHAIQDPVTATCLTTATTILRNNPDRLGWTVVNLGTTAMYIAWDRSVSATHGVYVAPNGGSVSSLADEDGELVGWELFGVAITAPVDIFTVEVEAA